MTNKELEELFQSKLGSRKVDFNPSSWEGMERMLDSKISITPWYLPFAKWVKGLTAAMVIGFSVFFIFGEPFEGYTKNGLPAESINPSTAIKSFSNAEGSRFQRNDHGLRNVSSRNSRFSNQSKSRNSSDSNGGLDNGMTNGSNSKGYAYGNAKQNGSGLGEKNERKSKKQNPQSKKSIPSFEDRFVENNQLSTKPAPSFEVDYTEQALVANAWKENNKSNKKVGLSSSPLKFGATFTAISSKDLMPESESTLNTRLKPAFALGFTLAQPMSRNLGISAGLNYKWQKADASSSTHKINYSFGEEHVYTTLEYQSLNTIEIPVSTYYRFADRHQVNLGLYASYLWAAKVKYNIETLKSFGTEKESGQHFNNSSINDVWDYGLTAGYFYAINSKFQIGVDSWFGLTPLQYNADFDAKANSYQLRFSLNYWFL
jgi:hypothetical protein